MAKSQTTSYVLTLPVAFDTANQPAVLVKESRKAASIYNACLNESLKRLHKLQHDRHYQALQKEYKFRKEHGKSVSDLSKQYRELFSEYGYSAYSLDAWVKPCQQYFGFGSAEAQKLAERAFAAVDKVRIGKADKVCFCRVKDGTSFEGKSHTSKLHYDSTDGMVHLGKYCFGLKIKANDEYAMLCMMDKVKYVRIIKKIIRGKDRWYAQLIMSGKPASKGQTYGDETVGLDLGTTTLAISTPSMAKLIELAPDCAEDEKMKRRIQRAMDRSKRAMNPENYNPNGTVKKGRHVWKKSKHYLQLQSKYREAMRRLAVKRNISHHILAKQVISLGTDIRVEKMNMQGLAKRSKKTTHNAKNGRTVSKKQYGKTIHQRAPAMLVSIINQKLRYVGKKVNIVNTYTVKASQYNPLTGEYRKKELRERMTMLDDDVIVQRDLLSAYCIAHTNNALNGINSETCYNDFNNFYELEKAEINRLRNTHTLDWYTA